MRKTVFLLILTAFAITVRAQNATATVESIEEMTDTNSVVTIADIIRLQERVTSQHTLASHFDKVWGNKSFLNLSYLTHSGLNPKKEYTLGYEPINDNVIPGFKSDFGFGLQLGHNYNLLKNPIANMVNFNIDYTYIDLALAHYKKEPGDFVYNSDNKWEEKGKGGHTYKRQYLPWALSKLDARYGMTLGPSITVTPFVPLANRELHFIKLNVYYHIGYQVGVLWMTNDKDADAAKPTYSQNDNDPTKLTWQHGLTQSFGFNLSWKTIGLGFETRWDNSTYKTIDTSTFGDLQYKFGNNSSRIYIRICY